MAALAACFALAALGTAVLAPQAMANREDCISQYVCLWDGYTYGTSMRAFHDNGFQSLVPFGANDITSSIFNNTNRWARLYEHADGRGNTRCIRPGQSYSLSGDSFDNQASAILITTEALC
jgi:hypothetical protein